MQSNEVFPLPQPLLVLWFPPGFMRVRLLSQRSSIFFPPFHIIKYKQMTEKVRWWERGSAGSEL